MSNTNLLNSEKEHLKKVITPIKQRKKIIKDEVKRLREEYDKRFKELSTLSGDARTDELSDINKMMKNSNYEYKSGPLISRLNSQINNPYFAKVKFIDIYGKASFYIGRYAHFNTNNTKLNIIDWRAPVATLYYNYTKPTKKANYSYKNSDDKTVTVNGEITQRLNFEIEKSKILQIYDNSLRVDLLKLKISQKSGGKLTDIVETIQQTQNQIIRANPSRVCIVQGTAGSGKTTIAVHRLSYIMYTYKDIHEKNTLLFSSSKVLINYVASTLPELDVYSLDRFTLEDFIVNILNYNNISIDKTLINPNKGLDTNILNSEQFINFLGEYTNKLKTNVIEDLKSQYFYDSLKLYQYFTRTINKPVFENLNYMYENINYRYKSLKTELNKGNITVEDEVYDLEDACKYLEGLFKQNNVISLYKSLLVEYSLKTNQKVSIPTNSFNIDHLSGLFLVANFLYGLNLKNKNYKQIIVDEAQDLGLLNYMVVQSIGPNSGFTILGDINQQVGGKGVIESWDDLNYIFNKELQDFFEIKVSYRTTKQIIAFAKSVLQKFSQIKHLPQAFEREGKKPVIKKFSSQQQQIKNVAKIINKKFKSGDIRAVGIIECDYKNIQNTKNLLKQNGINVNYVTKNFNNFSETGVYLVSEKLVKGLEFDTVFVLNPTNLIYKKSVTNAKRLFVLFTRSINKLYVFSSSGFSELI